MSSFVFIIIAIYPQFQDMMEGLDQFTQSMDAFGTAFGLDACFLFFQRFSNLAEEVEILRFFTPYYFAEPSLIITEKTIDRNYLVATLVQAIILALVGIFYYSKKNIK